MILDFETIRRITVGAAEVRQEGDGVHFFRMKKEELALYTEVSPEDFAFKAIANSGIRLGFVTDSPKLSLEAAIFRASGRKYYSIDVTVNDEYVGSVDNVDTSLRHPICQSEFEDEVRSAEFDLGKGEKTVSIYLPWSMRAVLRKLELSDGSSVKPAPRAKKMLVYGDSITQGYDAARPTNKYITRLAVALGADEYNKGIGGEIFFPALSEIKQDFTPDLITVAYGTNDWGRDKELDDFVSRCKQFFANLRKNYPKTQIYAITPIWRYGGEEEHKLGSVRHVGELIRECTCGLDVIVIEGYDLVPEERSLYADLRLHPNDAGFCYYTDRLLGRMRR